METVKVQWLAAHGQWMVYAATGSSQPLTEWAESLPDLTAVRLVLSAQNYSTHWLEMPGIKARHLARALPFALEESLINDVSDYVIIPASSFQKKYRAYVIAQELIENLLEACNIHHVQVRELIPETWTLGSEAQFKREHNGWLISIAGTFEGYVSDAALTPILESVFANDFVLSSVSLKASSMDQLHLLQSMLETSFPGQILEFKPQLMQETQFDIAARPLNILVGRFQTASYEKKVRPWWTPLAGVASVGILLWTADLMLDVRTLNQQNNDVKAQSISLYQQLFPGERIRSLERQFREKLGGSTQNDDGGFLYMTNTLARIHSQATLKDSVNLNSLRYNERLHELIIDVRADNLNDLEILRQGLEQAGLKAEVAQATNDDKGVKGRIRIGGQA